jgi:hypothetical protein
MLIDNYLPIKVVGLYIHIDSIFRMGPYGLFQVYGYLCTWAFPLFIGKYLRHGLLTLPNNKSLPMLYDSS